jgi:hypothetical protein
MQKSLLHLLLERKIPETFLKYREKYSYLKNLATNILARMRGIFGRETFVFSSRKRVSISIFKLGKKPPKVLDFGT